MVNIDIEEIKRKNEVIDNAIVELKKKYIGVDEQIFEKTRIVKVQQRYSPLILANYNYFLRVCKHNHF